MPVLWLPVYDKIIIIKLLETERMEDIDGRYKPITFM